MTEDSRDMQKLYKTYVQWLAWPAHSRTPRTKSEFLEKYNLTETELTAFRTRDSFADDVFDKTVAWAKEKTPDLIHQLYENVKNTKSSAMMDKWFSVIFSDKNKDKEPAHQQINIFNLDEQTKRQIADRFTRKAIGGGQRSVISADSSE